MVVGIGGPGAPHVYAFDRLNDVSSLQFKYEQRFLVVAVFLGKDSSAVWFSSQHLILFVLGLQPDVLRTVKSSFWERRQVPLSADDVILRFFTLS